MKIRDPFTTTPDKNIEGYIVSWPLTTVFGYMFSTDVTRVILETYLTAHNDGIMTNSSVDVNGVINDIVIWGAPIDKTTARVEKLREFMNKTYPDSIVTVHQWLGENLVVFNVHA